MIVDLADPQSLRRWLQVRPEQHRAILRWYWRNRQQHRPAIAAALNLDRA